MNYRIAERFKSLQGEGVYAGTPMAFIRFIGCSVGKKICHHCDTDFDNEMPWRGGGQFDEMELLNWAQPYKHICFTGGEPCNQNLQQLIDMDRELGRGSMFHVETSGTIDWMPQGTYRGRVWICVSPKPGFLDSMIERADEIKVIVPGLGTEESLKLLRAATLQRVSKGGTLTTHKGPEPGHDLGDRDTFRWPTLEDALQWARSGKPVFLQPRNAKTEIDKNNLMYVLDLLREYPQLRLSSQLHKILKVQ